MHFLVLLEFDLVKQLLPVVVEVVEELLMVYHLGLAVEKHGGGLAEVLASVEPFAQAIVLETLTSVLENVDTVDDERLSSFEKDLLRVKVGFRHPLDLFVVVMINLAAMIKHVANVRDGEAERVNSLGNLLIGSVPEAAHRVLKVLLNWVGIRDAVSDIGHAMEVEGSNEESLDEASNLEIVMNVVSHSNDSNECRSERSLEHLIEI